MAQKESRAKIISITNITSRLYESDCLLWNGDEFHEEPLGCAKAFTISGVLAQPVDLVGVWQNSLQESQMICCKFAARVAGTEAVDDVSRRQTGELTQEYVDVHAAFVVDQRDLQEKYINKRRLSYQVNVFV